MTNIKTLRNAGTPNIADIGYDLIMCWGQSNMTGRASDFNTTTYDVPVDRIRQFGAVGTTLASVISQAVEPLQYADFSQGTGQGPAFVFSRYYLQTVPENRRVLLVPSAYGGSPLSNNATLAWRRGNAGNLYAQGIALANAALTAAGPNSRIVACLWHQGEQDGTNLITGTTYQNDFDNLINGLRTDLGIADLPFIIGQMVPEYMNHGTRAPINLVHLDTWNRIPRARTAPGPFVSNRADGAHYNASGQRQLGLAMFNAYLRAITNQPDPSFPAAPGQVTGLIATPATNSVVLNWTAVSGATSYNVEFKTTVGSTWTDVRSVFGTTTTSGGLVTGTSYDFRCTAFTTGGPGTVSSTASATPT